VREKGKAKAPGRERPSQPLEMDQGGQSQERRREEMRNDIVSREQEAQRGTERMKKKKVETISGVNSKPNNNPGTARVRARKFLKNKGKEVNLICEGKQVGCWLSTREKNNLRPRDNNINKLEGFQGLHGPGEPRKRLHSHAKGKTAGGDKEKKKSVTFTNRYRGLAWGVGKWNIKKKKTEEERRGLGDQKKEKIASDRIKKGEGDQQRPGS